MITALLHAQFIYAAQIPRSWRTQKLHIGPKLSSESDPRTRTRTELAFFFTVESALSSLYRCLEVKMSIVQILCLGLVGTAIVRGEYF